ncbi:hypothetical protein V1512DRAFT_242233 [Lipomyces arxii]|uniref:uncharacterized protein n=1 Tax=Lipomyces arxii TaxID=56418 RepID=UPI0034CD7DFF
MLPEDGMLILPDNNLKTHIDWLISSKANQPQISALQHLNDLYTATPLLPNSVIQKLPKAIEDFSGNATSAMRSSSDSTWGSSTPSSAGIAVTTPAHVSSYFQKQNIGTTTDTSATVLRMQMPGGPLTPANLNTVTARSDIFTPTNKIQSAALESKAVYTIDLSSDASQEDIEPQIRKIQSRRVNSSPRKSPSKKRRSDKFKEFHLQEHILENELAFNDDLPEPNESAKTNIEPLENLFGSEPDISLLVDEGEIPAELVSAHISYSNSEIIFQHLKGEKLKDAIIRVAQSRMTLLEQKIAILEDQAKTAVAKQNGISNLLPELELVEDRWSQCQQRLALLRDADNPAVDVMTTKAVSGRLDEGYIEHTAATAHNARNNEVNYDSLPAPEIMDYGSNHFSDVENEIQELERVDAGFIDNYDDEFLDPDFDIGSEYQNSSPVRPILVDDPEVQVPQSPLNDFIDIDELETTDYVNPAKQMSHQGTYDPSDPEMNHTWSKEVCQVLGLTFKLPGFRKNQLEIINATLSGSDVFVLMPTGGGKSLCYQLPALVNRGKTRGTTIVISPLISLMEDQVGHLRDMGISAEMISSKSDLQDRRRAFDSLWNGDLTLLYISPEMLNTSGKLRSAISTLHQKQKLARIVIDEAHCVSSWGHDFRPDYQQLGSFRLDFPDVPMMALTATANKNVQLDIKHNLNLKQSHQFEQSFNRPNLYYEVRPKGKEAEVLAEIRDLMKVKHPGRSGIIYCHSKRSCESVAEKLSRMGLKVTFYHAGMEADERSKVQKGWQSGRYQAICATIAFGMGIDKANVRFVVHYTLPRNLEGYYQETGRAGRDGLRSDCILYYAFRDASSMMALIDRDKGIDNQTRDKQKDFMKQVVQYCENRVDCRRKQVLHYFSEDFDARECKKQCDNCCSGCEFEVRDISNATKDIISVVQGIQNDQVTLLYAMDVYRGSKAARVVNSHHDQVEGHGSGRDIERTDTERIFHYLVTESILKEVAAVNNSGFASSYVQVGPKAHAITSGQRQLNFSFLRRGKKYVAPKASASSKVVAKMIEQQDKQVRSSSRSDGRQRGRFGGGRANYRRTKTTSYRPRTR